MNLIIDIGNTAAKVALFDGGEMVEVLTESNQSLDCLEALCAKYPVEQGIVATVIDLSERVLAALVALPFPLLWLDSKTPLPVTNLYETPETLGYDRMAAVVGANEQYPRRDILVIDAGTCIPACRCAIKRFTSLPDACLLLTPTGANSPWGGIPKRLYAPGC